MCSNGGSKIEHGKQADPERILEANIKIMEHTNGYMHTFGVYKGVDVKDPPTSSIQDSSSRQIVQAQGIVARLIDASQVPFSNCPCSCLEFFDTFCRVGDLRAGTTKVTYGGPTQFDFRIS